MQITFTGHHMDVTDALRDTTTKKFDRLQRHFDKITQVSVIFEVAKLRQIAEATIHIPGTELHAKAESGDMYAAVDGLVDKLDRQLIKHKEKLQERRD